MKAALEASYHAGEATEPDWVREERALHKVDDQMARDVKSEATKSAAGHGYEYFHARD